MKIKLLKLSLKNFKGIKDLDIKFGDITEIRGANATGKTTIVDAFNWLVFGKDSKDRKDFNIKTLDESGNELHGLEHSVIGVLEVDGRAITLARIYKEKWTKTRGQAEKELKGHTTEYQINEVPVSMKEYQSKINEIFDEDKFKLITNPLYFTNMNWKEQRKILLEIIGDVSDEKVIAYNKDLKPLENLIEDGIDNFNKATGARIKKFKENVKSIPYRIDECNNSIVDENFEELEQEKIKLTDEITRVDSIIADKSKVNNEKLKLQDKLYELKNEFNAKYNGAKNSVIDPKDKLINQISDATYQKRKIESTLNRLIDDKKSEIDLAAMCETRIESINNELDSLRNQFKSTRDWKVEFNEENFICPTCQRKLEDNDIDVKKNELIKNFEERRSKKLKDINEAGKTNKAKLEGLNEKLNEARENITELEEAINSKDKELKELEVQIIKLNKELELVGETEIVIKFDGMENLQADIKSLEDEINAFTEIDNSSLLRKKRELQEQLDNVTRLLNKKDNNITLKARIKELEDEEKELSVAIAKQEGLQYLAEQFIRTKVELLEAGINKKFKGTVEFKLFDNQINGGLSETCEALIEGVPFSNANTAAQINAGLNILNTLCEHFNAYAPVFVDNAESVNKIGKTESQLIKLTVSLDKKLVVEGETNE